jgi:hypothetical protein
MTEQTPISLKRQRSTDDSSDRDGDTEVRKKCKVDASAVVSVALDATACVTIETTTLDYKQQDTIELRQLLDDLLLQDVDWTLKHLFETWMWDGFGASHSRLFLSIHLVAVFMRDILAFKRPDCKMPSQGGWNDDFGRTWNSQHDPVKTMAEIVRRWDAWLSSASGRKDLPRRAHLKALFDEMKMDKRQVTMSSGWIYKQSIDLFDGVVNQNLRLYLRPASSVASSFDETPASTLGSSLISTVVSSQSASVAMAPGAGVGAAADAVESASSSSTETKATSAAQSTPDQVKRDTLVEVALEEFFEANLKPGMAYHGSRVAGAPFTELPKGVEAKLVYQDGTACSASHAFSDVYRMTDGSFLVQTDCGQARFTGDSSGDRAFVDSGAVCKSFTQVFVELLSFCGHDPNTCGEMAADCLGIKVDEPISLVKMESALKGCDLERIKTFKMQRKWD